MSQKFDLNTTGKSIFDLRTVLETNDGLAEDVLVSINNGPGPSVILCGGIHGDEYEPQIVLRRLIDELSPSDVRGRLVIIPTLNFPASQKGSRLSPLDGHNMNRVFPGRSDGTATERLAAFLYSEVFPSFDLLVDVHSGGNDYRVVPMIFGFSAPGCRVSDSELETVMEGWGYRFIQYVNGIASTSAGSSPSAGVASVEIEGGSGGDITKSDVETMHAGIVRGLTSFGVLAGPKGATPKDVIRVEVTDTNQYAAPADGIVEHQVELGTAVNEGQQVALLHPASGASAEPIKILAPRTGYILRQRARAFVRKGELIGNTGTVRNQ
jgi:predicted deacylase